MCLTGRGYQRQYGVDALAKWISTSQGADRGDRCLGGRWVSSRTEKPDSSAAKPEGEATRALPLRRFIGATGGWRTAGPQGLTKINVTGVLGVRVETMPPSEASLAAERYQEAEGQSLRLGPQGGSLDGPGWEMAMDLPSSCPAYSSWLSSPFSRRS